MPGRDERPLHAFAGPKFLLETPRAYLRCWELADHSAFQAICSDPEVMRYVGPGVPWSLERTREFITASEQRYLRHGYCQWAVVFREASAVAGYCGFVPDRDRGVEIGWRLSRSYWGRGLATEVALAALHYAFTTLEVPYVAATVQAGNQASFRVAEKLGFTPRERFARHGRETWSLRLDRPSRPASA